mmetsp:Transcript_75973/g.180708  ORF Transcript_75973/g.180708 Transcript_75973/m.180708 type:complete len:428 (-) Transcript_75973:20-1303(-)
MMKAVLLPTLRRRIARGLATTPSLELDNGKVTYGRQTTLELLRTAAIFTGCRSHGLVRLGAQVLTQACRHPSNPFSAGLLHLTRKTAFSHFCGGETLEECRASAETLRQSGIRCIIDWSTEEVDDPEAWDEQAECKAATIQRVSAALGGSASFMPVKLTSLLSPGLLEAMTTEMESEGSFLHMPRHQLSTLQQQQLDEALERLERLCQEADRCGIPLLLDAEQSPRQPAVHTIAAHLMRLYNKAGKVVVYDTMQMYLRSSPERLQSALAAADQGGYTFAVKLVRGAYWQQEVECGKVFISKDETDTAYDSAIEAILERNNVSVVVATHNRQSVQHASSVMERLQIPRHSQSVHFAQILGMVDNITCGLAAAGYNTHKLVVFGKIHEVLPWLLRRMEENRDAFGAQQREMTTLWKELAHRFKPLRTNA